MAITDRERYRTGNPDLDDRLLEVLDLAGATRDVDQLFEIMVSVARLAGDQADRLNLKITNAALREMWEAFRLFAPYRSVPKVTIFGSARTLPDDPLYVQTRDLATAFAAAGWIIVTGAGPGIMAAGAEGAGPEHSIGVNIRLPFEQANPTLASDNRLVTMKYFFTRKLMLMKESAGFAVLPGGFGTLDEVFELLTLLQTGKAAPSPIVLLEVPGGTYWRSWERFVSEEVVARGLVSPDDLQLIRITDDVAEATAEIFGFFRNYHSMRYVGSRLVIRLRAAPTRAEIVDLNDRFGDILTRGRIESTPPQPAEISGRDHVELPRIALHFDRASHGRLRVLIDALNALPSAPPLAAPDADSAAAAGSPTEEEVAADDEAAVG
ncbi:MAG TPA: TIGR00730 family Rossman fold protein [Acidimicrobiia bacterium]|nr:TIGR00730 family Rossman fold protein [Acidimicrobiia bacterium]